MQQAASKLLLLLDMALIGRLDGWGFNTNGFRLEVKPLNAPSEEVTVHIRPTGWPKESSVFGRFRNDQRQGWDLISGFIDAKHLTVSGPKGKETFLVPFEVSCFISSIRSFTFKVPATGTFPADFFRNILEKSGMLDDTAALL